MAARLRPRRESERRRAQGRAARWLLPVPAGPTRQTLSVALIHSKVIETARAAYDEPTRRPYN
jgi:hypothetical protein